MEWPIMETPPDTYLHAERTLWSELPPEIHTWVAHTVGDIGGSVRDCVGGMATGAAAVVPGSRRTGFVKAIDVTSNPQGGQMYRREAEVAGQLPRHRSIPELWATTDIESVNGSLWRVNLLEARAGITPPHPWSPAVLDTVVRAWGEVRPVLAPVAWDGSAGLTATLTAWQDIVLDETDPWQQRALRWVDREIELGRVVDGGDDAVLSHMDLRADNILVDAESGQVSFLDWAHPGTAARWVDGALLLADVVGSGAGVDSGGPIDVLQWFERTDPDVDPELLVALVSALGAFLHVRAGGRRFNPAVPHRSRWAAAMSEAMVPFIDAH